MEVDATVGQMHVKMQKELAEVRSRYRTKLHKNTTIKTMNKT